MPPDVFIKPASDNLIVRDPVTRQPLAPEGEFKPRSKYWLCRLRDESVMECNPPAAPAAKKTADKAPAGGDQS